MRKICEQLNVTTSLDKVPANLGGVTQAEYVGSRQEVFGEIPAVLVKSKTKNIQKQKFKTQLQIL